MDDQALLAVLRTEAAWLNRPQHDGRKATVIWESLGLSETRYYQLLNVLLGMPEAWRQDFHTMDVVRRRQEQARRGATRSE